MTVPVQLDAIAARRFILGKQGLWPGRRWAGKAGTLAAIRAMEHLQLDPLVILARSHDLKLHSRVIGYQPALFDEIAYQDRACFDWGGWLAVRPIEELPYWRTMMRRDAGHGGMLAVAREHGPAIDAVRAELRRRPTVAARDFAAGESRIVDSYRGGKETSLALYYLWRCGEAMTHHREGFERIYAAAESVVPAHLLEPADEGTAERFMARKTIAYEGIGRVNGLSQILRRTIGAREAAALERELVDAGEITAVEVEGWRGRNFVLTEDLAELGEVAEGRVPSSWTPLETTTAEEATFLSPLDPVSARGRAMKLFGFEYKWEIYNRPEDVKYGRFTMPILWGDTLVGRFDARLDRKAGVLVVNGLWVEEAGTARDATFAGALQAGARRLMTFLGATSIDPAAVPHARLRSALGSLNSRPRRNG